MQISALVEETGVAAKTIRYYEEVQLLPPAQRLANGYRNYGAADVDRLKLVAGARRLDFSIEEIKEILDLRDRRIAPCGTLLDQLENKAKAIARRIQQLQTLEKDLQQLHSLGLTFPTDDVEGKHCVCHLVSEQALL